ncbi:MULTISPECIES: LysM peptidoglycan-binding domain-containing protein [unclassified Nostoc]|uniref:LysM peptidoglycan-binding domain-containing protein n=1 Tax=unclassified Nostoc TaxID=2593658 RepID=UPI002AD2D8A7|nr:MULTISPECIES: LysM peptidoglycan-binding domain-containing protein [unclassified Nostoc]MDZ8126350.1 LysM peptidoglycan-binding domain-containing protein [Nostoc sp. CmiVER01]MDZ8222998.1 LysM peptidoglycan-binding domain-containing protein [Nostoc sp. ChiVER01]
MATIKSADLRPIDSKSFSDFENYISEISDEAQALIVGGGQNVKVKRGDSLSKIASNYCGDSRKWPQIYKANRDKIGSNPNLIKPGQVLYVPCAPSNSVFK